MLVVTTKHKNYKKNFKENIKIILKSLFIFLYAKFEKIAYFGILSPIHI